MKCNTCGAVVSTEVREGVFLCDYCHSETKVVKEPKVVAPNNQEQAHTAKNKPTIDFSKVANAIVRIQSKNGSATGFFIRESGYVLTNAHVIENQPFVQGFIGDSPTVNEFEVKADGSVMDVDLALLELLDDRSFEVLPLAESSPGLGDTVFAVGNPKNLGMSVSKGAISRKKPSEYQLDMTLNPGNSGGPVINESAEIVGIVSYLLEEVNGLSFAIDIDQIQAFLEKADANLLEPVIEEDELQPAEDLQPDAETADIIDTYQEGEEASTDEPEEQHDDFNAKPDQDELEEDNTEYSDNELEFVESTEFEDNEELELYEEINDEDEEFDEELDDEEEEGETQYV